MLPVLRADDDRESAMQMGRPPTGVQVPPGLERCLPGRGAGPTALGAQAQGCPGMCQSHGHPVLTRFKDDFRDIPGTWQLQQTSVKVLDIQHARVPLMVCQLPGEFMVFHRGGCASFRKDGANDTFQRSLRRRMDSMWRILSENFESAVTRIPPVSTAAARYAAS